MTDSTDNQTPATQAPTKVGDENAALTWLAALFIIALGIPFRWFLLDAFCLDFDESMHFQVAKEPTVTAAWKASRGYTHPPLMFVIYHLLLPLGDSEAALRMPAFVCSLSALALAFLWLKELLGRGPALIGLTFLTFSMPMIHLASQMRSYMTLFTLVFGALYLLERFNQRRSLRDLVVAHVLLLIAIFTHYVTAWLLLSLGLLMLVRIASGTLTRREVAVWAGGQFALLGGCLVHLQHVRSFVGSSGQHELWDHWLRISAFDAETTHPVALALGHAAEYIAFLAGSWWQVFALGIVVGAVVLATQTWREKRSRLLSLERALLVLLPFGIAMLLFHLRIYPLGPTRHSLWLIPFAAAGVSAAAVPLLRASRQIGGAVLTVALAGWIWVYSWQSVEQLHSNQTPALMQKTVQLIRKRVPPGATLLTDQSTRYVLDYYLARGTLNPPQDLGSSYKQFQIEDYRVISIPKFHFYMYDLRSDWDTFQQALGDDATRPLWVVYFGFDSEDANLGNIYRRFPPGDLKVRFSHQDNQVMQVQFRPPASRKETASATHVMPAN